MNIDHKTLANQIADKWIAEIHTKKEVDKVGVENFVSWVYEDILKFALPDIEYFDSLLDVNIEFGFDDMNFLRQILDSIIKNVFVYKIDLVYSSEIFWNLVNIGKKTKNELLDIAFDLQIGRNPLNLYIYFPQLAEMEFLDKAKGVECEVFPMVKSFFQAGIKNIIFMRDKVIAIRLPEKITKNSFKQLHNAFGYSISYFNGSGLYYINGRHIDAKIFENISKENFLALENEDDKAVVITIIKERTGNKGLMDFLGAKLIDEQAVKHSKDYTETIRLYKTEEKYESLQNRFGEKNQPYCWSEFVCPSAGSTYLIDNSADFTDALEAARFLRPAFVPKRLRYQWKEFAN